MKAMDQDTIYLNSVPGMTESLLQGKATPLEELQENGTYVSGIDKQLESCEDE